MNVSQPTGSLISYDGVSFGTICCEHYRDSLIKFNETIRPAYDNGAVNIEVVDHPHYGTHQIFNCPFCGAKPKIIEQPAFVQKSLEGWA